ncbi:MAG: hypothetical protein R3183_08530 [Oleiphilaceae bacterium]|nr:hypothetical protein [Oleiphilaceae bacterium]
MKLSTYKMIKTSSVAAIMIGLLGIGAASQAGTELQKNSEASQQMSHEEPRNSMPLSRSNLRCWQEGKLLFEETQVNERSLERARQVLIFDQERAYEPSQLYLIESGSATCLYKKV